MAKKIIYNNRWTGF